MSPAAEDIWAAARDALPLQREHGADRSDDYLFSAATLYDPPATHCQESFSVALSRSCHQDWFRQEKDALWEAHTDWCLARSMHAPSSVVTPSSPAASSSTPKAAVTPPLLNLYLEHRSRVHERVLRKERAFQCSSHFAPKLQKRYTWLIFELRLYDACTFCNVAYASPRAFERPPPLKWTWPSDAERKSRGKWVDRWDAWEIDDVARRQKLLAAVRSALESANKP